MTHYPDSGKDLGPDTAYSTDLEQFFICYCEIQKRKNQNRKVICPSVHPSVFYIIQVPNPNLAAIVKAWIPRASSTWTLPPSSSRRSQGVPRPAKLHCHSRAFWVIPWVPSHWDILPGCLPLIQMPEVPHMANLNVVQWMYSTLSIGLTELLTISLRELPVTLQRKHISATCIQDLLLSVMIQS